MHALTQTEESLSATGGLMVARWRITLLGELSIRTAAGRHVRLPPNAWSLLAFLVASPSQSAARASVASDLWPEANESTARHCLASAVWRVKEALKSGPSLIEAGEDQIRLRRSRDVWIDVIAFDRRIQSLNPGQTDLIDCQKRLRLKRALDSYEGDFATGIDVPRTLVERERLRTLFLDGLFTLAMSYSNAGDWTTAARVAQRLCHAEPLREDAHRLLMIARTRSGNRALALRQFEDCRAILARELNVEPMAETTDLYRMLREDPSAAFLANGASDLRTILAEARQSVSRALGSLEPTPCDGKSR
jgi:DNA-binding SARP family transcriptional activator